MAGKKGGADAGRDCTTRVSLLLICLSHKKKISFLCRTRRPQFGVLCIVPSLLFDGREKSDPTKVSVAAYITLGNGGKDFLPFPFRGWQVAPAVRLSLAGEREKRLFLLSHSVRSRRRNGAIFLRLSSRLSLFECARMPLSALLKHRN